jgi:hypothetical protein
MNNIPDKTPANHAEQKSNRTGEDIDMLHEKESDPESSSDYGSDSYKDNYDAA